MKVEIGHKIKEVFDTYDMKLIDFADQLGTVRQNVYRIFKKRHLDTGLLIKVSEVLNHNFFQYYVTQERNSESHSPEIVKARSDVQHVQRQLDQARKEIEYLRKIIKLMEEKAELVQQIEKEIVIH